MRLRWCPTCMPVVLLVRHERMCPVRAARDKIQELASKNSKFKAVDRAIGRNSLKVCGTEVAVLLLQYLKQQWVKELPFGFAASRRFRYFQLHWVLGVAYWGRLVAMGHKHVECLSLIAEQVRWVIIACNMRAGCHAAAALTAPAPRPEQLLVRPHICRPGVLRPGLVGWHAARHHRIRRSRRARLPSSHSLAQLYWRGCCGAAETCHDAPPKFWHPFCACVCERSASLPSLFAVFFECQRLSWGQRA